MKTSIEAFKIMGVVLIFSMILFLIVSGFGRLTMLFELMIIPFIWIYKVPLIGISLIITTGVVIYAITVNKPSDRWKDYEKNLFKFLLVFTILGFLISNKHAGTMFLASCLIAVLYPIIQIVRTETRHRKIKGFLPWNCN